MLGLCTTSHYAIHLCVYLYECGVCMLYVNNTFVHGMQVYISGLLLALPLSALVL